MATSSYGLNTIVFTDAGGESKTITVDVANSTIDFGSLNLIGNSFVAVTPVVSSGEGIVGVVSAEPTAESSSSGG